MGRATDFDADEAGRKPEKNVIMWGGLSVFSVPLFIVINAVDLKNIFFGKIETNTINIHD